MSVNIIVGTQWGDEGKGKITDILAENTDMVVRYQGGNNAGHTVCVGEKTFKLHLIPAGILNPKCTCVIANGVVLDPEVFFQEIDTLKKQGIEVSAKKLKVSSIAHVILPLHKLLDKQQETTRSDDQKIGTTGRGIGPAYADKISRAGLRVIDLLYKERIESKVKNPRWKKLLPDLDLDLDQVVNNYVEFGKKLKPFITDSSLLINEKINEKANIILEGAQGAMLDVDHGTYPFVTSSNPISGGACVGAGVGPHKIDQVIGVTKAYVTRVGEGPFPTEETGKVGEFLREQGAEFGTTTGRPRRCGWLDLVGLRYACRINGVTEIVFTKLDVLDGLDEIKLCNSYKSPQGILTEFPTDPDLFAQCEPIYDSFPGWKDIIAQMTDYKDLPNNAKNYIHEVEKLTGVRVSMVSVGSRRNQTIHLLTTK